MAGWLAGGPVGDLGRTVGPGPVPAAPATLHAISHRSCEQCATSPEQQPCQRVGKPVSSEVGTGQTHDNIENYRPDSPANPSLVQGNQRDYGSDRGHGRGDRMPGGK